MAELDRANREGFGAMIALATKWGIPIPEELFSIHDDEAEKQWRTAHNRAWSEIERDPPPFMSRYRNTEKFQSAA